MSKKAEPRDATLHLDRRGFVGGIVSGAVIAGAGPAAADAVAGAELDVGALPPFWSRSAAEKASLPEDVTWLRVMTPSGRLLNYVADPEGTALATDGGKRGWSPAREITLQHFGENTHPGITDMRQAFERLRNHVTALGDGRTLSISLSDERVGIRGTLGLGHLESVRLHNGTLVALGDAADYPSLPNDLNPESTAALPGPLIDFNTCVNISISELKVECRRVSSGFRFWDCQDMDLHADLYIHGWAAGGYGVCNNSPEGRFTARRARLEQYHRGEQGAELLENRDGFGWLMREGSFSLVDCQGHHTGYPLYRIGEGAWSVIDGHFNNGGISPPSETGNVFSVVVRTPGEGVLSRIYSDLGALKIYCDNTAGGRDTNFNVDNIYLPTSSSEVKNKYSIILSVPSVGGDISGISIENATLGSVIADVFFDTAKSEDFTLPPRIFVNGISRWDKLYPVGKGGEIVHIDPKNFTKRSDLKEFGERGNRIPNGKLVFAQGLRYIGRSGSRDIEDLEGFSPTGKLTPNHFQENLDPGSTDMTSALRSAFSHSLENGVPCYLLAEDYYVNGEIPLNGGSQDGSLVGFGIVGAGRDMTRIIQGDGDSDTIHVQRGNGNSNGWMRGSVRDFTIIYPAADGDKYGKALRLNRCLGTDVSNITIEGPSYHVYLENVGHSQFNHLFLRSTFRRNDPAHSAITLTENGVGRCFNVAFNDTEHQAGMGVEVGWDIRAVDTLKVNGGHTNHCRTKVKIRPNNTKWQTHVFQVFFSDHYFDGGSVRESGLEPELACFIEAIDTFSYGAQVRIEGLYFDNCFFRGGAKGVFHLNNTKEGVSGLATLEEVFFSGCEVQDVDGPIFRILNNNIDATSIVKNMEWIGGVIEDGPRSRSSRENAFALSGKNIKIVGVTVQGGWDNFGDSVIQVSGDCESVEISNNIFDVQRSKDRLVSVSKQAKDVSISL